MKRALVTGATGMLGGYIAKRLLDAGWSVRGLVRDPSRGGWLEALGGEAVPGELADPGSLLAAAAGCDAIFHAAATIGSGSDWEAFRAGNVRGVENVVRAAEATDSRLVHVSSTAVFGRHRYRDVPTDESVELPVLDPADAYGRSKQDAERVVLRAHAAGRLWACVVRPPMMYGRRDRQFVPRLAPVLEWGFFPLVGGGGTILSLVHANAVADGAVRAASSDAAGGRVYHLTDDFEVSIADLLRYAGVGLGRRVRPVPLSPAAARLGFRALAAALTMVGRRDLARHAPGMLEMLTRSNPFTSERARRELGWSPELRPAEGLPDAFAWWREHRGEIPARA